MSPGEFSVRSNALFSSHPGASFVARKAIPTVCSPALTKMRGVAPALPESPAAMRARQAKSGNPVFDTFHDRLAVALDLGEESVPVGDDEPEIADASLVNARIVDFVDDAVTDGEPDAAPLAERCADPVLGA